MDSWSGDSLTHTHTYTHALGSSVRNYYLALWVGKYLLLDKTRKLSAGILLSQNGGESDQDISMFPVCVILSVGGLKRE